MDKDPFKQGFIPENQISKPTMKIRVQSYMKKLMADDTKDAFCLTELDHVTTKKLTRSESGSPTIQSNSP